MEVEVVERGVDGSVEEESLFEKEEERDASKKERSARVRLALEEEDGKSMWLLTSTSTFEILF